MILSVNVISLLYLYIDTSSQLSMKGDIDELQKIRLLGDESQILSVLSEFYFI